MMPTDTPRAESVVLDGIIAEPLQVRSGRIRIDSLEVMSDIGFHDFEIGSPQRLLISVDLWLDDGLSPPLGDDPANAWDYDFVVREVRALAGARRYNLQETLAHAIFARLAAIRGVRALKVRTVKPDVYPDVAGVGVEIASFEASPD
jgi:dihydroneopterin aldolase